MCTAPTSCYSNNILIQSWHPLGKLKTLLHSLEEWKAFILFLATSLTCWKSLKLEMASSNGFKCASFSSSLHKLKKSDHHLSILWSPPKSAWEVVTPNSSNVPPYSLYFTDFLKLFSAFIAILKQSVLAFWNQRCSHQNIVEKSVVATMSYIQNSWVLAPSVNVTSAFFFLSEYCSHSWRILCSSAYLVEKLKWRALAFCLLHEQNAAQKSRKNGWPKHIS